MLLERIEKNLIKIQENLNKDNFIYDFLEAYEQPKSSIKRLKDGDYNLSKKPNEVIWKKKIYFYSINENQDVHDTIDTISKSELIEKNKIRFIIVTDFKEFLSIDKKNNSTLDINFFELSKNANFFIPLSGFEKFETIQESEADRKAAVSIGKLYEQILINDNKLNNNLKKEDLNLFFSRFLFLCYADDANVFEKNIFLKTIKEITNEDGNDLDKFFYQLFEVLDCKTRNENLPNYFSKFPYVNGNLFKTKIKIPKFTRQTREIIIENASLDWQNINPDILGSMLQSVINSEDRSDDGMHYTSVSNILKVIKPLFLDNLENQIEQANKDEKKLTKILKYIYNIKVFDPACGSGNFLIISYSQLCFLEIKIFKILNEINPNNWRLSMSGISINQFYGIEQSHYATETAKLSLWIAQHQMNLSFEEIFGVIKPSLPLIENQNILNANSATIKWFDFCKKDKNTSNIFLVGNPPYKGFSRQSQNQKKDMEIVLGNLIGYKRFDYITLWLFKAAKYLVDTQIAYCGFVSTNSICQGEHLNLFWPKILDEVEIHFAVKPFMWGNNATNNATVSCVIIGLSLKNSIDKILFDENYIEKCKYISPYLSSEKSLQVQKRDKPICLDFPKMIVGNMPYDGGFLKLDDQEYQALTKNFPESKKFFRKLIGGNEFINGHKRWVIWLHNQNLNEALNIKDIKERINKVLKFRENAGNVAKGLVKKPHQFRFVNEAKKNLILVPYTSSKSRYYLPIGFLDKEYIVLNSAKVIYDPFPYIFGVLSSRTFLLWVLKISGKMGDDSIRFSSSLCYNTFPILEIPKDYKNKIEDISYKILDEREKYSDKCINELYSQNMPKSLKDLHKINDDIIDNFLFGKININEQEKILILFNKYKLYLDKEKLI